MKFCVLKEQLINRNKFSIPFEFTESSIQSIVKAPIFDTDFIISIDYFDDDCAPLVVNYKCTKTGGTRSVHYFYLKDLIDDYENFLEFLGAIESVEKEYSYVSGIVKDICIE